MSTVLAPAPAAARRADAAGRRRLGADLLVVAGAVAAAELTSRLIDGVPLIVAAVVAGMAIGNSRIGASATAGLAFASTTILRFGIVLLGLRLSLGDVTALGWSTLAVIALTVTTTFFGVQYIGRRMGLSQRLSLLVASGFSICGNSAVAAVSAVIGQGPTSRSDREADDAGDDIAAAVGLVTLCGTLAIVVIPSLGRALGLETAVFGTWIGASVQDTAQVIAVASAAGPPVLAIATAVKLTRVLFLAPIVAGVSIRRRRDGFEVGAARPRLVPTFVLGFVGALLLRTAGVVPTAALDLGDTLSGYALAAGMVGLGSSVRIGGLRRLGIAPLALGAIAWVIVGAVSLAAVHVLG